MTMLDLLRMNRGFKRISGEHFCSILKESGYKDVHGAAGMTAQFRRNPLEFLEKHQETDYSKKLFMLAWTLGQTP
jgi:hypothetical protein